MKKRLSRWTAVLLCIVMVSSMLPTAWAASKTEYSPGEALPLGQKIVTTMVSAKDMIYAASKDTLYALNLDGNVKDATVLNAEIPEGSDLTIYSEYIRIVPKDGEEIWLDRAGEPAEAPEDPGDPEAEENKTAGSYTLRDDGKVYAAERDDPVYPAEEGKSVTAICMGEKTLFVLVDGEIIPLNEETVEVPVVSEASAKRNEDGTVALAFTSDCTGTLYYALDENVFDSEYRQDGVANGQNNLVIEGIPEGQETLWIGVMSADGQRSETAAVTIEPADEPVEEEKPVISEVSASRDASDKTKAEITLTASCDGTVYYSFEKNVFESTKTQKVTEGENTISLTGLKDTELTLYLGMKKDDAEQTESEIVAVTIPAAGEEPAPAEKKTISDAKVSRTVKYTNKKNADVGQITVTFQSSFQGNVYYTVSEALAEDIITLGKKKSVTKGKNTIQLTDSESKTLWIGWEDGDGTVKTKQVNLDPPTVYTSKITLNPKKGKLTIKYNGTILTPKKSGDGWHQYELVVGETYQFIAKVPNSKKYKEVNQSVSVQKKSNYTINISRGAGRLSDLILNTNKTNSQNGQLKLSPAFSSSTEEYSAELVGGANTAYLWLKPRKDSTKLKVTAGKRILKSSLYSGYHRYTVKFSDNETKKTIKVTASGDDGTVNTYTITLECYEKFELALVRDLTGRTGANTLTLTLSSPRKGQGYLKVVNPGVNVTEKEIISEGYKFRVNKGNTMLKISGLASVARDIYVIAEDEDGNRTPRLKIEIKPYKDSGTGTRTRPDSRNSTTPSNGPDSPVPSTNNDSYSIDSSSWDDDEESSGGEKLLNSFDEGLDAIADEDGETVDIDVGKDAGTQADQQQAAGSSADGSVPSDSVLSGGMPIWAIVLILAIAATGAVGIYWFVIRARSREDEEE